MEKISLKDITIVAVACVRVDKTLLAMKYSCKDIEFGGVKLFTHENIVDDSVEVVKIDKLDYENYNRFIVYDLHKYIDTKFCLIIQDDGFVINPTSWRNEFFDYDYIGAIWSMPMDNFSYRDSFNNIVRVGNGGFSLRSKKLLALASELGLEWKSYFGYYNEDGFFCCHNKHIYVDNGCKFAPMDVAKYFSHEAELPDTRGIEPFGFHGKTSKYNSLI